MPDLNIAAGIASGVSAFQQAYNQTKLQKFQMKQAKNDRLAEILLRQIQDPNTSFYERSSIINEYQKLYDPKPERRLSTILGYDKLNEKDFIVEEGANAQVGKQNQSLSSEQTNSPNQGQTLQLQDTQSAEGVSAITKKYGETTPAEIHNRLQLSLEKARDTNDVDKQVKILKANYTLQAEILNKGGFTKEVSRGYDAGGNFQILMTNGSEVKPINLGKFTPEALAKAKIMAGGKAGGNSKLGQLMHANSIIDSYNNDPTSISYSDYTGAKQFIEDFEKTGQVKDATVVSLGQKNTGTQKIQPGAAEDNARADENNRITRQTSYDNAVAQSLQTSREAADFATQANAHVNNVINPLKERIASYLKEQGYVEGAQGSQEILTNLETDSNYKALQNQLRNETANYEGLKAKADSANARDQEAKQKVIDAKNRLGNSSSNKSNSTKYSAIQRAMIERIRKDNPNADLSDDQIAEQILASPFKAKFK